MMGHPDPAVLELRRMRAEMEALIFEQRCLVRSLLNREDRRIGRDLFPRVAGLVGPGTFTGPSLLAGSLNDRTPAGPAARDWLADLVADTGGLRAFGWLLARLENVVLSGYRLQDAGETGEGRRWRLVSVSGAE